MARMKGGELIAEYLITNKIPSVWRLSMQALEGHAKGVRAAARRLSREFGFGTCEAAQD